MIEQITHFPDFVAIYKPAFLASNMLLSLSFRDERQTFIRKSLLPKKLNSDVSTKTLKCTATCSYPVKHTSLT